MQNNNIDTSACEGGRCPGLDRLNAQSLGANKMGNLNSTATQSATSGVFAYPMVDDPDFLYPYNIRLEELQKEGELPDLQKEMNYNVYSIQRSQFGAHKSIVLSSNGKKYFTVELGFMTAYDQKERICPVTNVLPEKNVKRLKYHGTLQASGADLIAKAIAAMKEFGRYFMFTNNCQNYCNTVLKKYGLDEAVTWPDQNKAAVATIGIMGVGAALLTAFLAFFATGDKSSSDSED